MSTTIPIIALTTIVVSLSGPPPAAAAPEAKKLFSTHCAGCHGPDGRANTVMGRKIGVKDLTQSQTSEADIARQIREGAKDAKGEQKMPAFQERLTDEEIAALVAYTKALRSGGAQKND